MPAIESTICDFNAPAIEFLLPSVDGSKYNLEKSSGKNGLLVMFICNHCPYVKSILERLVEDCNALIKEGVGCVAISSNDAVSFPQDSFDNMKIVAQEKKISFPYLYDKTQKVAKDYGAVCTPDFFGYNKDLKLQYRGRFDDSGMNTSNNSKKELLEAMLQISKTGQGPKTQMPSIGCSIKWL